MRTNRLIVAALAIVIWHVALAAQEPTLPPSNAPTGLQASRDDRYRIGLQDVLDVQVFRHPELNIRASVNPDGMIYLYRLDKPISAVCKTERELARDIEAAYKVGHLRDPQVNVTVAEQRSQSMAVIGAVEKPGSFFVSREMNLLQLLALAGGPNKESGTRLFVVRGGSVSACQDANAAADESFMSFKIRDVQEGKVSMKMRPGDVISVLKADIIYVYGNVIKPGPVEVREPITLTQAIATAEGLKPATDRSEVRIIRQRGPGQEPEDIVVNLGEIEKRRARDPILEPNDIVAVSKDRTKDILVGFKNAITNGLPSIIARGVPVP